MARSRPNTQRQGNTSSSIQATLILARWQLRQTWRLLLIIGVGILVAVILICSVPLYSEMVISAGVRNAINSSFNGPFVKVHGTSEQVSQEEISKTQQQIYQEFHNKLGRYGNNPPQFSLQLQSLLVLPSMQGKTLPHSTGNQLHLIGSAMQQAGFHLKLLQGRLPRVLSKDIEIAIEPITAADLHLKVGDTIPVQAFVNNVPEAQWKTLILQLHVVGIFQLTANNDLFWHREDFQRQPVNPDSFSGPPWIYKPLASNDTLLSILGNLNTNPMSQFLTPSVQSWMYNAPPDLYWYYDLNAPDANTLNALLSGLKSVVADLTSNNLGDGYLTSPSVSSPINDLETYQDYITVIRIPATCLLLLLTGMVLYFVSTMTGLMVDRESEVVAIMRSRGAERRQIFAAFTFQGLALGLVALIVGPLVAIILVRFFVQHSLSPGDQSVLNLLTLDPFQVATGLLTSALLAVIAAILAMMIALYRASRLDILALRRQSARATPRTLQQRFGLDSVAAIIALVGYGFSLYIADPSVLSLRVRALILAPITLTGTIFLLIAVVLLFLRIFPLLLQLGTQLANRSRAAAPLLALAQMARAPRQAIRTAMLLALATALLIFTLVFAATQSQRITDVAAYQVGADFSGGIAGGSTVAQSATYSHIPGVLSASVGYMSRVFANQNGIPIGLEVRAVDATTYAQAATWTPPYSSQSLSSLMTLLVAQRAKASANDVVPALVDASAWTILHLSTGTQFTIHDENGPVECVALAEVQHIPTVNDTNQANDTSDSISSGGILLDYQSYAAVYLKANGLYIPTTTVWLHTLNDPISLATVRNQLLNGPYHLDTLNDRRAIIATLSVEPLYIALLGVLVIGATLALFLAFIGNLIATWQNARSRLTSFAMLRAIGSTQQQVTSILFWEQGIIYSTSLTLGLLVGLFLAAQALPTLVFTTYGSSNQISIAEFYAIQSVPPVQIVIPPSLWLALTILLLVCIISLGMMVRVISHPSMSQTLRLNED